jgi:uncharacterized membrane protein (UPF0136 family)
LLANIKPSFLAGTLSSLNFFLLNFLQYMASFVAYTNAFLVEKLLLLYYAVIRLLFKGFQKLLGGGGRGGGGAGDR